MLTTASANVLTSKRSTPAPNDPKFYSGLGGPLGSKCTQYQLYAVTQRLMRVDTHTHTHTHTHTDRYTVVKTIDATDFIGGI